MNQYGEPWEVYKDPAMIRIQEPLCIYLFSAVRAERPRGEDEDFVQRIVACVNACAGIPNDVLRQLTTKISVADWPKGVELWVPLIEQMISHRKGGPT